MFSVEAEARQEVTTETSCGGPMVPWSNIFAVYHSQKAGFLVFIRPVLLYVRFRFETIVGHAMCLLCVYFVLTLDSIFR